MKHLTKILTLLLAFLMVISPLTACDKTPEPPADTTVGVTEPVTEAPTEPVTEAPTAAPQTEAPTAAPETAAPEVPTEAPATTPDTDAPAKSGCGATLTVSAVGILLAAVVAVTVYRKKD